MAENANENWGSGASYEQYVGRWSRKIANAFFQCASPKPVCISVPPLIAV
jgi:hypothetical protein